MFIFDSDGAVLGQYLEFYFFTANPLTKQALKMLRLSGCLCRWSVRGVILQRVWLSYSYCMQVMIMWNSMLSPEVLCIS